MKCIANLIGIIAMICVLSPAGSSGSTLGESYLLFGLNEYDYNYSEADGTYPLEVGVPRSDEYGATSVFHVEGKFYSKTSPLYGGFLFEYGGGIQTYNGTPLDSFQIDAAGDTVRYFPPLIDTKSNTFTRIGGFIGPYFKLGNYLLGFNAGLLYYNWYRGASAYNETYTWVYLPLGAELSCNLNDRLSVGLDLQYRIMLSGVMQPSYVGENVIEGNPTSSPQFTLGTRDGFYFGIPVQFEIDRQFGIEFKPWFEYRPSGISPDVFVQSADPIFAGYYLEPNSTSYSIGISISAMFGNFSSFDRTH